MRNLIIGIDPGLKGGFAQFCPGNQPFTDLLWAGNLPVRDCPGGGVKKELDLAAFSFTMGIATLEHTPIAVIEAVHAMPAQGVVSTFNFGRGYGELLGILAALKIPTFKVVPAVWKAAYGLSYDKKLSIKKAKELFPEFESMFVNDGIAEAAIIAHFGQRFLKLNKEKVA